MPNARAQRTAREIQARRALGDRRKRSRKLPRALHPMGVEREYTRALIKIVAQAKASLKPLLDALPELLGGAKLEQSRLDAGESRRAAELTAAAEQTLGSAISVSTLDTLALEFARKTATWQRRQMSKQVRAAFGIDLAVADPPAMAAAIEGFQAGNVGLMRDLGRKTVSDIESTVQRGIQNGVLHKDLAKEIEGTLVRNRNRARLIARDQVGKFYGKVTKVRQEAIGVSRFKWRTANDERVRDEHAALEGQTFKWSEGAQGEGIPGEPINCRCFAEPVLDDILS